jgi:hypothetical protein
MAEAGGRETLYVRYLRSQVDELIMGQGHFTMKELAAKSGLKLTANMRRRVRQWVDLNDLYCWHVLGSNGRGSELVYTNENPKEIPF